ncbi:hypothetical protein ABT256_38705 [Amycolatopsis japonica]|uniref:hypothetical protein n=1 Tax=Amycolatopsis japonica TaxID=208439 RepID=UPI0033218E83
MPLTTEQRRRNEAGIRAAMDRLLLGQLPARGGCDLKTLAREAGVARTGFYARTDQRPGPYQHLAEEFQRRWPISARRAPSQTRANSRSPG